MFEKDLMSKVQRIFGIEKVTYKQPSEVKEQECIWIDIERATPTIKDSEQIYRVTGRLTVFGSSEKLPFGFFAKAIHKADVSDTEAFFFHEFESNTKYYLDLVQRDLSFVYNFSGPYDPEQGEITIIDVKQGSN